MTAVFQPQPAARYTRQRLPSPAGKRRYAGSYGNEAADFHANSPRLAGSIQFFTATDIVVSNVANLTLFRPCAVAVPLGPPFSVTAPNF